MWGAIIGFIIGASLSYNFILPTDILNLRLAAMTIGDLLRIFGALVATLVTTAIGHLVDIALGKAD